MVPTTGRIVLYTLSEYDAESINKRRVPQDGNSATVGDVLPAVIIRPWGNTEAASANLQVLLDGTGSYWATSRSQGDEPGQWHEPPRV